MTRSLRHLRQISRCLVIALWGCGTQSSEPISESDYAIVGGEDIETDPAAIALVDGDTGNEFCSGTVVSKQVVVTAAHCVPPNFPIPVERIQVFFGSRMDGGGTMLGVVEVKAHPQWRENSDPFDIGILRLASDAPVDPSPMLGFLTEIAEQTRVRLVGFGITGTAAAGNGIKRQTFGRVSNTNSFTLFIKPDPGITCNGDSGGPLFYDYFGVQVLAGIHSRSNCKVDADADARNERIDIHVSNFVMPFIETGEGLQCGEDVFCNPGCAQDPDCPLADVHGGCQLAPRSTETGTWVLALGLAGLAGWLSRRRIRA